MTENEQFVSIDDGLDFSIKHIGSGEVFYDCDSVVDILNDQDMKIKQLEKSIERREEQISIIKKHCKTYLTEEQYKTIKEALSVK